MKKHVLLTLFWGLLVAGQPVFGMKGKKSEPSELERVPYHVFVNHILPCLYEKSRGRSAVFGVDSDGSIICLKSLRLVNKKFDEFVIYFFSRLKPMGIRFEKLTDGTKYKDVELLEGKSIVDEFLVKHKILIDVNMAGKGDISSNEFGSFLEKFKNNIAGLDFCGFRTYYEGLNSEDFLMLAKCTKLKQLSFKRVKNVTSKVFESVGNQLESVTIYMPRATFGGLEHLCKIKTLKELNLGHVSLTSPEFEQYGFPSDLEKLSFHEMPLVERYVTNETLQMIKGLDRLKEIAFFGCHALKDEGFSCIPKNVKNVCISDCRELTSKGLLLLATLKKLVICGPVGDTDLEVIGNHFKTLKHLEICYTKNNVTEHGMKHFKKLQKLEHLEFGTLEIISPYYFEFLPDSLRRLVLDSCCLAGDFGDNCFKLPANLERLELWMEQLQKISPIKQLKQLVIKGYNYFSVATSKAILKKFPNLQYLDISDCAALETAALTYLPEALKTLHMPCYLGLIRKKVAKQLPSTLSCIIVATWCKISDDVKEILVKKGIKILYVNATGIT